MCPKKKKMTIIHEHILLLLLQVSIVVVVYRYTGTEDRPALKTVFVDSYEM